MMLITSVIEDGLQTPLGWSLTDDEREIINQLIDKIALVANGDANFLQVDACYAINPK